MKLGLVTSEKYASLHPDDRGLVPLFRQRGIDAEASIWTREDRPHFDAYLVRTPWDYSERVSEFRAYCERMKTVGAPFVNSIDTILWNLDKRYLLALEARGVPVVPSAVVAAEDLRHLRAVCVERGFTDVIVKPTVSASAVGLRRFEVKEADRMAEELASEGRDVLVQPFEPSVVERGELSFIFFGGRFSHAVRKLPPSGDFRAQEHLGGKTHLETEPDPGLVGKARAILDACDELPTYARVDVLETAHGVRLMELELIEPLLYLAWEDRAASRLVDAVATRLGR